MIKVDEIPEFGENMGNNRVPHLDSHIQAIPVVLSQKDNENLFLPIKIGIDIPLDAIHWSLIEIIPGNHIMKLNFSSDGEFYLVHWMRKAK